MYEKLKNNDNIYNLTVTEYLRLRDISSKESYNINKAIQTGVVKEDTIYADYFLSIFSSFSCHIIAPFIFKKRTRKF